MKSASILTILFLTLAVILVLPSAVLASGSNPLLWNRLGSDAEVTNSEIGPDGVIIGGIDYLPGKFDNGFKPQPRTGDRNLQTNCVRYDGLNLGQKGCIEFWFQPDWVSGYGHIRHILGFAKPDGTCLITFHYNDWQNRLGLVFYGGGSVYEFVGREIVPSSTPEWSTTEPFHVAIVWDGTAADNADKLKMFLNGVERGSLGVQGSPTFEYWGSGNYLWLATRYAPGDWNRHNWEGSDGIMDNIKIWNYAKTDFEDRFIERVNQAPIANAGPDQMVHPGAMVILDGSGSSDPDEDYPLTYYWQIISKPEGSTAELSDPCDVNPSFVADMLDDYIIELVVTDSMGAQSIADSVLVSTFNTPPVADAGPDQAIIELYTTVQLDGTQSYDFEGDPITYFWTITQKPAESIAELDDPCSVTPTFVADVHGDYVITLVVTDIFETVSEPDNVIVSFENVKPVADAGVNQDVVQDDTVNLDGSGSYDGNGDLLTYSWSIVSKPVGSLAELSEPNSVAPSFVADLPGEYIVSLVVNDGFVDSDPANVTILAITCQEAAAITLVETVETVNELDPNTLKNENLSNALTNKINAVLKMIDKGKSVV